MKSRVEQNTQEIKSNLDEIKSLKKSFVEKFSGDTGATKGGSGKKRGRKNFADGTTSTPTSTSASGTGVSDEIKHAIIEEINKIYDIDVESIRNLGIISKSLLTGKNYHKYNGKEKVDSGTLVIPANVIIEGTLIVKNTSILKEATVLEYLKVNQGLAAGAGIIGNTFVGSSGDNAIICHKDMEDREKSYALLQKKNGQTQINTISGTLVRIREGDSMTAGAVIGDAYVGTSRRHKENNSRFEGTKSNEHVEFSHINNKSWSIVVSENGEGTINTPVNKPLHLYGGGDYRKGGIEYAIFRPGGGLILDLDLDGSGRSFKSHSKEIQEYFRVGDKWEGFVRKQNGNNWYYYDLTLTLGEEDGVPSIGAQSLATNYMHRFTITSGEDQYFYPKD